MIDKSKKSFDKNENLNDKVKKIDAKRQRKENLTYEEFVLLLSINEELDFEYSGILYSIVHNPPFVFLGRNVVYENGKYTTEKVAQYSTVFDLLDLTRIDNKAIKDIWEFITIP